MAKKKKLSVLSDNDESSLSKLSKKERAKAIDGKPDDSDIRNISELLRLYEKSHPGLLKKMKADYDLQNALKDKPKPFVKGVGSEGLRMAFWLPRDFQEFLEIYYPSLWSNKDHANWFIKQFPIFKA